MPELSEQVVYASNYSLIEKCNSGSAETDNLQVCQKTKEAVMARRNDACKADPSSLEFSKGVSPSSVRIFDHLTPKMQYVFTEAKKFKGQNNYQFCWTKHSCVYLLKDGSSRALKIRDIADLTRLG